MRSIWRRATALCLAIVLMPSLVGGGACVSHLIGDSADGVGHAAHSAAASPEQQSTQLAAGHEGHSAHDAAPAATGAGEHHQIEAVVASTHAAHEAVVVSSTNPHDCCPAQSAPEHCSGAAGCSAAVSVARERATAGMHVVAVLNRAPSPIAPPGPANAPEVPPPRG